MSFKIKVKRLADEYNSWALVDKVGFPILTIGTAIVMPMLIYAAATGNLEVPENSNNQNDVSGGAIIFMAPPIGPGMGR